MYSVTVFRSCIATVLILLWVFSKKEPKQKRKRSHEIKYNGKQHENLQTGLIRIVVSLDLTIFNESFESIFLELIFMKQNAMRKAEKNALYVGAENDVKWKIYRKSHMK